MHLDTFFSISQHTALFLLSVVLGAALGVVYDCFRVFRIVFPPAAKNAAVAVEDIIFWLIYGFCVFCYSAVLARGQVRFFIVLGSLIGFVLYLVTIGNAVTGIIRRVVTAVYTVLRKVYSCTIEPFVKILRIICQKAAPVFVRSYKNTEKDERSFKKPLKKHLGLVYNKKAKLGLFARSLFIRKHNFRR